MCVQVMKTQGREGMATLILSFGTWWDAMSS